MKKVLLASLLLVALASCGNSFEREAHHALRDEIKATAKNPDTYKITDEQTILSEDSMIVITFTGNGENGLGGRSTHQYEYIYGIFSDGKKQSCLRKIDEDLSNRTFEEGTKSIYYCTYKKFKTEGMQLTRM